MLQNKDVSPLLYLTIFYFFLSVQKGVCYHLYSRAREQTLDEYPLPEIQRTRLEEIILHVKILRLGSVKPFLSKVMMPPDESVVDISLQVWKSFVFRSKKWLMLILTRLNFQEKKPNLFNIIKVLVSVVQIHS